QRLIGYSFVAYTTYSSLPTKQRYRVFIPYAEPISAEQHGPVFEYFQRLFDGAIDSHCATPCQFSYTASCPPDGGADFHPFYEVGELFDPNLQVFDQAAGLGE